MVPSPSRHDSRLKPNRFSDVIVGARDFTFVADVDPGPIPNPLQFHREHRWIAVERSVNTGRPNHVAPLRRALDRVRYLSRRIIVHLMLHALSRMSTRVALAS
jgi:hypothetical protein